MWMMEGTGLHIQRSKIQEKRNEGLRVAEAFIKVAACGHHNSFCTPLDAPSRL